MSDVEQTSQEPIEEHADGSEQQPIVTPAATPSPWWRQKPVLIGAGALLIVIVAVGLVLTFTGGSKDLKVTFTLEDFDGSSDCSGGSGGYSDVGPGMPVVVRDNDQHVIGTGELGSSGVDLAEIGAGGGCIWSAVVTDLPSGEDYYSVTVGHRGESVYTSDQLDADHWSISLTLGG